MLALLFAAALLGHQVHVAHPHVVFIEAGYRPGFSYPGALSWVVSVTDAGRTHYVMAGHEGVSEASGLALTPTALSRISGTVERVGFFSLCSTYSPNVEDQPTVWLRVARGGPVHYVSVTGPALLHGNEDVVAFMEVWRQVVRSAGEPPSPYGRSPFTFTFGYS